jgi:hypothetical protein
MTVKASPARIRRAFAAELDDHQLVATVNSAAAAAKLGCSRPTARRLAESAGVTLRPRAMAKPGHGLTDDEVRELLTSGVYSPKEIRRRLGGVSRARVCQYRRELGLVRPQSRPS